MKDVMILTGAGQIGMAIARRMGFGKKIVIGDKNLENARTISVWNRSSFGGSGQGDQGRRYRRDNLQPERPQNACLDSGTG